MQEQAEHTQEPLSFTKRSSPSTHFIETAPSVLRHVPWIQCVEHKVITFYRTCMHTYITDMYADIVYIIAIIVLYQFICIRLGIAGHGESLS